jgi:tetratricopeptide (TPR) repeat protein
MESPCHQSARDAYLKLRHIQIVDSQLQAGRAAYQLGNIEKAVSICRTGIAEAKSRNNEVQVFRLRVLLSQCHWAKGEYEEALLLTQSSAQDSVDKADPRAKVQLLNQRGFMFTQLGRFAEARVTLEEALRLAGAFDLLEVVGQIEISRATLFFCLCDYESVEACGRSALAIAEKVQSTDIEASACAAMGKSAMYCNRQADAIPWFERALALYEKEDASAYADIMRSEMGCCHFALGRDDKASAYFIRALQASREAGAQASLHIDLANMGCLHLRRGEYAAAISHFQEALQIARKLGDSISVSKWLGNLALTYSHMGNPALAASFQKQADTTASEVEKARAAAR